MERRRQLRLNKMGNRCVWAWQDWGVEPNRGKVLGVMNWWEQEKGKEQNQTQESQKIKHNTQKEE